MHQAYHNQLDDENEIEDSLDYYEVTMLLDSDSKEIIEDWIKKFKNPSRATNLSILDPKTQLATLALLLHQRFRRNLRPVQEQASNLLDEVQSVVLG